MELIDRKAAIDALRLAYWDDNIQSAKDDPCIIDALTDWAIRQIKALPSAEPTQTNTHNALKSLDCISRQAAIDALNDGAELLRRVLDDTDIVGTEREKYEWGLGLIESYIYDIEELPSAQPDWDEMLVICDCCGHAIHVKRQ